MQLLMKSAALVVLLLATACGSSGKTQPACTAAQNNESQCNASVLEHCDGRVWTRLQDCAASNEVCTVAVGATEAGCAPPVVEGGACDSTLQCATGLECSLAVNAAAGVCLDTCDPSAATPDCLDSSRLCAAIDSTAGLCEPLAPSGGLCAVDAQCPADTATCHPFRYDATGAFDVPVGACAATCRVAEINMGQGSCADGLFCLLSPARLDPQSLDGAPIGCSTDSVCDQTQGYTCVQTSSHDSYCARDVGVCGDVLPMYGTVPDTNATDFARTTLCAVELPGQTDYREFCGVTDAAATVRPTCVPVFSDDLYAGICMATCTPGSDNCGAGYTCVLPAADDPSALWDLQLDASGNAVLCGASTNVVCDSGYVCQALATPSGTADYCARLTAKCSKM